MPTVYNKVVADNTTLIDLSQDTVTQASHIVSGYVGHLADGTQVTGTGGGGGPTPVPEKDVNFIDYDGTILYSYTAQEAAALSDLPANPSHTGLTAQGWNYTLAQMKAEVTAQGKCTVGQMYTTSDGKTRIYCHFGASRLSPYFGCCPNGTVTVDWGDESATDTLTGSSLTTIKTVQHTYAAEGDYVITITPATGTTFAFIGASSADSRVLNKTSAGTTSASSPYQCAIRKVELGTGANIGDYAFSYCMHLESITIPKTLTSIGNYAFQYYNQLKGFVIPNGTTVGTNLFRASYTPIMVSIPVSVTSITTGMFQQNYVSTVLCIPSSVTSIGQSGVANNRALTKITIPSGVTTIGNSAFSGGYSFGEIVFQPTSAPTMGGSSVWSNLQTDCIIYIPYSGLASYLSASNYPSKTSYTYIGYATYASGAALPSKDSTNAYNVTWYASKADAIAQTNAISQGTGGEIYCRYTAA